MRRMIRLVPIIATRTASMRMMREMPVCVVEEVNPIKEGRVF